MHGKNYSMITHIIFIMKEVKKKFIILIELVFLFRFQF